MARPSEYPPLTKSYAIDQIEDIEHLRRVAHLMWEAFYAAHSQAAHAIGTLMGDGCKECEEHMAGDRDAGCAAWRAWQVKVSAGFGTV
jgi:hypothetical protein